MVPSQRGVRSALCMFRFATLALLLGVVSGVVLTVSNIGPAAAAPIGCQSGLIYTAANSTTLRTFIPGGSTTTLAVSGITPNSIAYNDADGNLYALAGSSNVIDIIQADGTATSIGTVTGLPNQNYFAATFSPDGTLWLAASTGGTTTLYAVNVSTLTAISVTASTAFNADLVWINGTLYALKGTSLAKINPTTGQVTTTAAVSGLGGIVGAMWFSDGHLFVQGGTGTNAVLQIQEVLNYQSGTPTATLATTLSAPSPADGASCATAPSPFVNAVDDDFSSTPVSTDAGGTVGNVFGNDTVNGATATPALATATITNDGGATGAAIATDGTLTVPAGVPAGSYTLTYSLCETANPALCDPATVTFVVAPVAGASMIGAPIAGGVALIILMAAGFLVYRRRRSIS